MNSLTIKRVFLSLSFLFVTTIILQAQSEEAKVIDVIKKMFDSMRAADSVGLKEIFHPNVALARTFNDKAGKPGLNLDGNIGGFITNVGNAEKNALDERIYSYDVRIDQNLATVWTDFTFFYKGKISHCGVNTFQLFKSEAGWKIISIVDTKRTENCIEAYDFAETTIDELLNNWHKAATDADADTYFGLMTDDSYFIGTDETERWDKASFQDFAKKAFAEAPAWDFKTIERNIEMDEDRHRAWFDEKLDTWMGVCRGSGVVVNTPEGWKIKHYVLSVTVPNEKIQQFIDMKK